MTDIDHRSCYEEPCTHLEFTFLANNLAHTVCAGSDGLRLAHHTPSGRSGAYSSGDDL